MDPPPFEQALPMHAPQAPLAQVPGIGHAVSVDTHRTEGRFTFNVA